MSQEKIEISNKEVIFYDDTGNVKWRKGLPTVEEWQQCLNWVPKDIVNGLIKGEYMYATLATKERQVVATFYLATPSDWNLWLDCKDGELKKITESR